MREVDAFKAKWRALDAEKPGERELLARMEELRAISLRFLEPDFTVFLVKDTLHKALEGLWGSLKLAPLGFADLVGSLDGNRTIEMSREWVELVAALRGEPRRDEFLARLATKDARDLLGTEARTLWERFLERNGHNRTSWDIAVPCWSDAPEQLAPLLAASIAGASAARGTKDRQIAAAQKLRTALGEAGLGDATGRVESAVALLRDFMRMDEELHFLTGHLLEPSRKLVLAAGSWLAGEGLLARADDAFFMELGELKGALRAPRATLRFLAERRRAEFERACKSEPPFEYPVDELPLSVDSRPRLASDRSLLGKAMSGGVGEGIVVIAEHLGGVGKLERGSVLVTTAPNPAFVPLYPLLGGIVSATGGMLSHGFVAAREFGLPAVSGIADATTRLKVGTRVRVDGERGVVEIL
ncbi:MAG: hypothetical protein HY075_13060 [Deltaproteobacteria bacterium]|nr:hypothetical protein [Deltaproteobacteria bacterium]